jgi:hypothetical protein
VNDSSAPSAGTSNGDWLMPSFLQNMHSRGCRCPSFGTDGVWRNPKPFCCAKTSWRRNELAFAPCYVALMKCRAGRRPGEKRNLTATLLSRFLMSRVHTGIANPLHKMKGAENRLAVRQRYPASGRNASSGIRVSDAFFARHDTCRCDECSTMLTLSSHHCSSLSVVMGFTTPRCRRAPVLDP